MTAFNTLFEIPEAAQANALRPFRLDKSTPSEDFASGRYNEVRQAIEKLVVFTLSNEQVSMSRLEASK
jgi:hypothetical protein